MADPLVFPQYVGFNVGTEREVQPRVLRAPFGHGYNQRSGDGLNAIERTYSVSFVNLTRADSKYLEDFFKARGGFISFSIVVPGETVPTYWIAKKWKTTHTDALTDSMTCEWEEVFVP